MYCKKMLLAVKKCSTNQICRLSTSFPSRQSGSKNFHFRSWIRYTIKYLKDGLIIFTQKERKGTMQTKDSEEVVARFGAKLI